MFTLKIDPDTNDLIFDNQKNIAMVYDQDEENQSIRQLLSTRKGEFFLDITNGLDFEPLMAKNFDHETARLAVLEALEQEPRVEEVQQITFNIDSKDRKLTIEVLAKMSSGNIIGIQEVIDR